MINNYQGTLLSLNWTKIPGNPSLFTQILKWYFSTSNDLTTILSPCYINFMINKSSIVVVEILNL